MFVDMKAGYGRYHQEELLAGQKRAFRGFSVMLWEQEWQSGRSHDAVLMVGMDGRFIHAACVCLGYSYEEMLQMNPADIYTPEYAEKVPEWIKATMEQGRLVFETVQVRKDGTPVSLEWLPR